MELSDFFEMAPRALVNRHPESDPEYRRQKETAEALLASSSDRGAFRLVDAYVGLYERQLALGGALSFCPGFDLGREGE